MITQTKEERLKTFTSIREAMLDSDFEPHENAEDADTVAQNGCGGCGEQDNVEYHGFKNKNTGEVRSFAVCTACGNHSEF